MTVNSVQVQLAVTKTSATQYPSTLVQNLYVYDGGTLLGTFPINSSTVVQDSSNVYYVILSGFNFNIPGNTTKTLTITADFPSSLDTSRVLTIGLYGNSAIRAVDPSGAYSTATTTSDSAVRNYTITYSTVGTSTLTASIDPNTPVATDVAVNATSGTTGVPVSVFDLKSTTGASTITQVKLTVTGDALAIAKVNAVNLYDGSTLIGSQSLTGGVATFSTLSIPVAQDSTKILTAKVDMASGVTSATKLRVSIATPSSDVTYNEPNMSSTTATGTATGNYMYFYDGGAPAISFVSAAATYTPDSTTNASNGVASGVLTFNFQSNGGTTDSVNGDPVAGDFTVVACANSDTNCTSPVSVSTAIQVTPTSTSGIANGGTATVAISAIFPQAAKVGYYYFKVTSIAWTMSGVTESTSTTTLSGSDSDSSAVTNWKTNPIYVH
jgi:hypothetical protein